MSNAPVDSILGHLCVALGQGTGAVRISRAAIQHFHLHYRSAGTAESIERWETVAGQALERIRAVGRLASQAAIEKGKTAIDLEEVERAIDAVETDQDCELCPPRLVARGIPLVSETTVAPAEVILGQICAAFGQGTGAFRVSGQAVAALRERYQPLVTPDVLRQWEGVAVQVLERMRAIGRLAAHHTTRRAYTAIGEEDVLRAARTVEAASATPLCPPQAPPARMEIPKPTANLVTAY
jgi:hypothetical protein